MQGIASNRVHLSQKTSKRLHLCPPLQTTAVAFLSLTHEITTLFGLYAFSIMCFGLKNTAQTFQRFINGVLQVLTFVFAYIDDFLIASSTAAEHVTNVRETPQP